VGGGDQPGRTDDGRSTHVTETFDVKADLPGKLPGFCILAAHNTRRLEHAPPAVCNVNNKLVTGPACRSSSLCLKWVEVRSRFVLQGSTRQTATETRLEDLRRGACSRWRSASGRTAIQLIRSIFAVRRPVAFGVHFTDALIVFTSISEITAAHIRAYREGGGKDSLIQTRKRALYAFLDYVFPKMHSSHTLQTNKDSSVNGYVLRFSDLCLERLTSPTVELIGPVPTVVCTVAAILLGHTFCILARHLSGFASTFDDKSNGRAWEKWPVKAHVKPSLHECKRVSPQFCSSVRSPQSSMPSHFQNMGLHNPFLQLICFVLHSGGNHRTHLVCQQSRDYPIDVDYSSSSEIRVLTAVVFIAHVSAVIPAVTLERHFHAALITALELLWTSCGWRDGVNTGGTLPSRQDMSVIMGVTHGLWRRWPRTMRWSLGPHRRRRRKTPRSWCCCCWFPSPFHPAFLRTIWGWSAQVVRHRLC